MNLNNKAAVFILLGQSNAVGHKVPMEIKDQICAPLKNVFGLKREDNQSFTNKELYWSGYTSDKMNLAEEQDHTYSVANCLARLWQSEIDSGNKCNLPDLYIVHIAIGGQGVKKRFMWNPDYEKKLIAGKLGQVDISLYPFTVHILSLLKKSLKKLGKTDIFTTIHWRGGEEDATTSKKVIEPVLKGIYDLLFNGFYTAIGDRVPTVLHKIVAYERYLDLKPSGEWLESMNCVNQVFGELCDENKNMTIFDVKKAPQFIPNVRGNGIFLEDVIHYTPETNIWVAEQILSNYKDNYC
jgi:hypothetical protein